MENWTIKELKIWSKTFDNTNSTINYFLGGASQETIDEARAILKEKQNNIKRGKHNEQKNYTKAI
tara:strand:- start:828 stop:1022 length:195 start_codon:yes stop_codon:yes gene_type:complete